jgi:O-antigen/teichoic acid export membrane protein
MKIKQFLENTNNRIVAKNTFFAFVVKGIALLVSLLTTSAYIDYFENNAVLGVWYTMLSVLMWFLNFDLGVGNGIRNKLVKDLAQGDREGAKRTISSGMLATGGITLIMAAVGFTIIRLIDVRWLFHVEGDMLSESALFQSTCIVFGAILCRFFLTSITAIVYALQKSALNDFMTLSVSVLQLVFVLLAKFDTWDERLLGLSVAYLLLSNLPVMITAIVLFLTTLKDCRPNVRFITRADARAIVHIGAVFFYCQILYMLIINTNEFLITRVYGPEYTTEYSLYYKITSLISLVVTMAMTPIWSVVTKALAEKNMDWLRKLYRTLKFIGAAAIAVQFLFILFQQFAMDIWLRDNTIQVELYKAFAFACFGAVFIYSTILSTIACGLEKMKLQACCYTLGVLMKFVVVALLHTMVNDWTLVVWCNVGVLLPYCILQQLSFNAYFKKTNQ